MKVSFDIKLARKYLHFAEHAYETHHEYRYSWWVSYACSAKCKYFLANLISNDTFIYVVYMTV